MAEITCPMCGKPNPADRDVCQYCEARLKPLTDELSRSQPPLHPGEEPTELDTGQLESTLPKWLREIRKQARETDEESGQPPVSKEAGQEEGRVDRLAGLSSQAESQEEIPDWLAGLRSEGGEVGFEDSSSEEDDLAALQNMLGQDNFESKSSPREGSEEDTQTFDSALPAWLKDTGETNLEETDTGLPSWLSGEEPPAKEDENAPFESEGDLPAWLQDKDETRAEEPLDTGLPAWLSSLGEEEAGETVPPPNTLQPSSQSTSDWLASLGDENLEGKPSQPDEAGIKSTTDWLASLEREDDDSQPVSPAPSSGGEMPDWLSSHGTESTNQDSDQPFSPTELPDWLAALGEENSQALPAEEAQVPEAGETPDWLSALGEESYEGGEQNLFAGGETVESPEAATGTDLPDWLATLGEEPGEGGQIAEEMEAPSFAPEQPASEADVPPTFIDDEGQPISSEDVEAIFSMDMPDWLSDTQGNIEEESTTPAAEEEQGSELHPVELPSWVQAMRPIESVITETKEEQLEDQPVEERGPLAGLRGVLPAVAGVGPSSKPKAYSVKLQASEDQLSSAALLERMLLEETSPIPVVGQKTELSQRVLRWIISAILILVVGAGVYYSPQISPVPTTVPLETSSALDYIRDTLPSNAPVLLVFDYEAARAGEMEATAAPLIDQMLTLKSPRLSLISSTPTGVGLAERFMKILQADRDYARNEKFVNLGYLPGGAAGVQAFAGNPVTTKSLTNTGAEAWSTPVLQDVKKLSDFAAIILLTDNLESSRIWIEQTEGLRDNAGLLVVSSAQSGPMIRPYVRSGQVLGMVTGLDGGAPIEQANSGRPGMARRYWDAFGFGLLAAVVMITIGSFWNMASAFRSGRKAQGKG